MAAVAALVAAPIFAMASIVIAVANDGVPAEEYDAGNRFAMFSGWVLVTSGLMVAVVAGLVAMRPRASALTRFFVGLTPSVLAIGVVPWWWNR